MNTTITRTILLVALCGLLASTASGQLEWRVSVKFILDANGNLPTNGTLTSHAAVNDQINDANQLLQRYGRGYQMRITEIVDLAGVSSWFDVQARNGANRAQLERDATSDPTTFAWRGDAINVYINNTSSAICSLPPNRHIIFSGSSVYSTILFHEIGHYFNLLHTHDGELVSTNCSSADGSGNVDAPGDSDGVNDTPPDQECWTRDQVARNAFGQNYANLSAFLQNQVDNTYSNIMSYHLPQDRLTSGQLDRATDASNGSRQNVCNGRTVFVDKSSACISPDDLPGDYKWWIDRDPPQGITWGSSSGTSYRISPPAPAPPPGWPPFGWSSAWPPDFGLPRPPTPPYPSDWTWPPQPPPPIDVCFGGPLKTFAGGLVQASPGDIVLLRPGNYNEPMRITKRVALRATRGNVSIGRP